jgi:hypothetical protein
VKLADHSLLFRFAVFDAATGKTKGTRCNDGRRATYDQKASSALNDSHGALVR